jgi:hypothetical protein
VVNENNAELAMHQALEATRRLPACTVKLWGGLISEYQLKIIGDYTTGLSDEGAAEADQILATAAPGLTSGQLRTLALRVAMMIDPEAVKAGKKDAAKHARVEKFMEIGGTGGLPCIQLPGRVGQVPGDLRQLPAASTERVGYQAGVTRFGS